MMTGIRPTRSETRPVIGFATMAAAVRFALAGPKPDPADSREYLYASGLRTRPGVAVRSAERPVERTLSR